MFKRFCAPALLLVFTFGGCGSGTTDLSEGGIGGTGISIGPITGFGSILQNGVHYDVSQADFVRNGLPGSTQADFRIGEVVTINGQLNTNGTRGTAQTVTFRSLLQGVVTTASPDGRSIGVLGQTVLTDGLTVLHGFTLLNQIVAGNLLEVSGARDADGVIRASSIRLLQARFIPGDSRQWLEGVVRAADTDGQTFELGTLTVDYRQATLTGLTQAPAVGDYVRVSSRQNLQDLRLSADQVEAESVTPAFATGTELELKGLITQFADSTRFRVNGQPVITTATTEYEYGSSADLALNTGVAVEGVINAAGVLVATEVALRQDSTVLPEELEGSISSLNSARQEITVLGNVIRIDAFTLLLEEVNEDEVSIRFADLNPGDQVEVQLRRLADGSLLALRVDREAPDDDDDNDAEDKVSGVVSRHDAAAGTLELMGLNILTNPHTEFADSRGIRLSHHDFFAAVSPGVTPIRVEGRMLDPQWLDAMKMELRSGGD